MKYEKHKLELVLFDKNDVFTSWLTESGENMDVTSFFGSFSDS